MERFIPVKVFERKVIPSEVFPFSRFYRNSRKFLHTYQCHVILLRKNAKELKDGGRFPNLKDGGRFPKRVSLQCVSLLVGSVGRRFRTQLQPCR